MPANPAKSSDRLRNFWIDFHSLAMLPRPRMALLSFVLLTVVALGLSALAATWIGVTCTGLAAQVLPTGFLDGGALGMAALPSGRFMAEHVVTVFALMVLLRISMELIVVAQWIGGAGKQEGFSGNE